MKGLVNGPRTIFNLAPASTLLTKKITGNEIKLRRIVQIVSDIVGKPFHELRILDLACLERLYAIEFARCGAEVVAKSDSTVMVLRNVTIIAERNANVRLDRRLAGS